MARGINTIIAASALVALAGCADAVRSTSSQDLYFRSGVLSTFAYAAAPGEMRTVVIGNPFTIPKAELDRIVTAAMDGNHFGPPTTFTTEPSDQARASYRIVMLFDPPRAMDRQQVCAPAAQLEPRRDASQAGTQGPDPELRLLTGFCAQNQLLSWVTSSMNRPASPDDPAFRNMIANATFTLIPSRDQEPDRSRFID